MDPKLKLEVPKLGGIEEILPQANGMATKVENFTVDPATGGWDNRIGYEKFFPNDVLYAPFTNEKRIHSLYVWSTHNGARTYYLYESENIASARCDLSYLVGNTGSGGGIVDIDRFRRIPTLNEPVTDYEPFGRYLIIVNGHDKPLKFDGEKENNEVRPLGWDGVPSPPSPWRVDVDDSVNNSEFQNLVIVDDSGQTDTSPVGYSQTLGLGYTDNGSESSYRWKITWISETGSESPLSASS